MRCRSWHLSILHLKVREVENRLGVSNQTGRTDLHGLDESGYLKSVQRNKKEKIYIRSEDFADRVQKPMSNLRYYKIPEK